MYYNFTSLSLYTQLHHSEETSTLPHQPGRLSHCHNHSNSCRDILVSGFLSSCAFSSSSKTSLNRSSVQLQVTTQWLPGLLLLCCQSAAGFVPLKHSLVELRPTLCNYHRTCWSEPLTDTAQIPRLRSRLISLLGRQINDVGMSINYWTQNSASNDYRRLNLGELIWELEKHWFLSYFLVGLTVTEFCGSGSRSSRYSGLSRSYVWWRAF